MSSGKERSHLQGEAASFIRGAIQAQRRLLRVQLSNTDGLGGHSTLEVFEAGRVHFNHMTRPIDKSSITLRMTGLLPWSRARRYIRRDLHEHASFGCSHRVRAAQLH